MESGFNFDDFLLENYNEAKVPEQTLEIIFQNETLAAENIHGQERCQGLVFPFSRSNLCRLPIKDSTSILDNNIHNYNKDIMAITLDTKDFQEFEWLPGDTIGILPSNCKENVYDLLQCLDLNDKANHKCFVKVLATSSKKTAKVPVYIPTPTTPREILQDCLNIKSVLKKQFLSSLAEYCTSDKEKLFLKCLSSKDGSLFYNNLIIEKGLCLLDILKCCASCKPPLSLLVEHLTRLLPRPYSIANSPLKTKEELHIIFSILKTKPGLTTEMLKDKSKTPSSSLLVYLREPNLFRYSQDDFTKNQILIAIGTSVAPFLGFLQHKECIMQQECNTKPGKTWLFLGSTSKQATLYRQQLLKWQSTNVLNKFFEAHSREEHATFKYVQDSLNEHSEELFELFSNPATNIFVCADGAHISKSIEKSLHNILIQELKITLENAVEMLKDFKNKGKYREDVWL